MKKFTDNYPEINHLTFPFIPIFSTAGIGT
jgi:hypothetical protein